MTLQKYELLSRLPNIWEEETTILSYILHAMLEHIADAGTQAQGITHIIIAAIKATIFKLNFFIFFSI